jgi:hypothetical protein
VQRRLARIRHGVDVDAISQQEVRDLQSSRRVASAGSGFDNSVVCVVQLDN